MRRLLVIAFLLGTVLVAGPASGADRIDKRKVQAFARSFFAARPWTAFHAWDPERRAALLAEAKALGSIPEGSLEEVVDLLWKAARKEAPKLRKTEIETPYGPAVWDETGRGGRKGALLIGLHGGGEGAGDKGEAKGNWSMSGALGIYPQGIRLVHDTWNTVHGERFVLSLIEMAKVRHEIDPDRVYVVGFSMGGTGSLHVAGRHPDLLAGAIPAHGVMMAAPKSKVQSIDEIESIQHGLLPNLRNLAVYTYTGYDDRNCEPWTFLYAWKQLDELKAADPEGYQGVRTQVYEGLAHAFPPGEPSKGLKWIAEKKRDTFPEKLVWEYAADPFPMPDDEDKVTRIPKSFFYWIQCTAPRDGMYLTAARKGNEIDVEAANVFAEDLTIYLNPEMIDVGQDVVVRFGGKEVYRGRPQPDLCTIVESLDARMDRRMVFDRRIHLPE